MRVNLLVIPPKKLKARGRSQNQVLQRARLQSLLPQVSSSTYRWTADELIADPTIIIPAFRDLLREFWKDAPPGADYANRLPFGYVSSRLKVHITSTTSIDTELLLAMSLLGLIGTGRLIEENSYIALPYLTPWKI